MDIKKRIKNPIFWITFIMAIFTFLRTLDIKVIEIDEPTVESIVYGIFGVLAVFGVAVDPTTPGATDGE